MCELLNAVIHSIVFTVGCTLRYHAADPCKSHMNLTLLLIVVMSGCVSYFQWYTRCGPCQTGRVTKIRKTRTRSLSRQTRLRNSLVSLQRPESEYKSSPAFSHKASHEFSEAAGLFEYSRITCRKRLSKDNLIFGAYDHCHNQRSK